MATKMDTDRLKDLDIADIIGRYIPLKKDGVEHRACCPFHDENTPSFSVNSQKGFYYCFGCGATGDAIDFVRDYTGCSFVEACEKLGANVIDDGMPVQKRPSKERVDYYEKYTPTLTDNRIKPGQSITLINPKRDGKIWEGAKPEMVFPYATAGGDLHGYVLRFTIKGKKLTPMVRWCKGTQGEGWHNYPFEEPRFLYRLLPLIKNQSKQVLIVEGEKAADAAAVAMNGKMVVISWSGGTNGTSKTDWGMLQGRKIFIWPDNDAPGIKAGLEISKILIDIGVTSINFITPPTDLPKGWDCADRSWTTEEIIKFCKEHKTDIPWPEVEPEPEPEPEPEEMDIPDDYGSVISPENDQTEDDNDMPFRILGHYHGKRFYLPNATQQIVTLDPAQHSKNNLLALAPLTWWKNNDWDLTTKGGLDFAINGLLQLSSRQGLFNADRMRGRGAWLDDGRAVVHIGQKMVVDGVLVKPEKMESKYIYQQDIDLGIEVVAPSTNKQANALPQICQSLSWENDLSATLLAGWCVIAPLTGILPWRPHVWVTGPSGVGKSTVLKAIISVMLGDLALVVEGKTTEAGIRQQLGLDARPVLFDEAEAEDKQSIDRLKGILDFARVCSSGGTVVKGTTNGDSIKFSARAIFCFSSINTSIKHFADESRISQLVLKQDFTKTTDYFKELELNILNTITPAYASAMFSRSVCNMETLQANTKVFTEAAHIHFRSRRIADQIGALLAGAHLCYSTKRITRELALKWIERNNWEDHTTVASKTDNDRLISKLMTSKVKIINQNGNVEISIGEAILACEFGNQGTYSFMAGDIEDELKRIGILVKGNAFFIANSSDPLRAILRETPWENSWGRTLKEITGSEPQNTQYFAPGIKCRSVLIPTSILKE